MHKANTPSSITEIRHQNQRQWWTLTTQPKVKSTLVLPALMIVFAATVMIFSFTERANAKSRATSLGVAVSAMVEKPSYVVSASEWVSVTGTLKQVSLGCDYARSYWGVQSLSVWGVNSDNKIYQREGDSWKLIEGNLSQISVGQEIWGVNAQNQIFQRSGSSWKQIAGTLKQISVGCDGSIWGITPDNKVQRRKGADWEAVSGTLKQISVGNSQNIWGTNANNEIFYRQNEAWVKVTGSLAQVAVDQKGEVWGINSAGKIFRRARDRWLEQSGTMSQLAISSDAESVEVWAVDANGQIYESYSGHLVAGYAYHDPNQNRQRDAGEPGVAGFTVYGNSYRKPDYRPISWVAAVSNSEGFFYYERPISGAPVGVWFTTSPPSAYPFITQASPDYGLFEGLKVWLPVIQR